MQEQQVRFEGGVHVSKDRTARGGLGHIQMNLVLACVHVCIWSPETFTPDRQIEGRWHTGITM